jgi:hypothetical protein
LHGRGRSAGIPGKQQVRAKINYILMSDLKKQAMRITPGPNPQNIIDFGRELALTDPHMASRRQNSETFF